MQLKEWEATIRQIAVEINREPTEAAKQRVLTTWRAKLQKPPTSLQAYQIEGGILAQVRQRLRVAKVAGSIERDKPANACSDLAFFTRR